MAHPVPRLEGFLPNGSKSSDEDEVSKSAMAGLVTTASSVFMLMVVWELPGIHNSSPLGLSYWRQRAHAFFQGIQTSDLQDCAAFRCSDLF